MPQSVDLNLLVHAVALSGVYGVNSAAAQLDISRSSIVNYRRYAAEHPDIQPQIEELRSALDREWALRYGGAILRGVEFLEKAFEEFNPKDPEATLAVIAAIKTLSDVRYMSRMLDLRLAGITAKASQLPAAKVTVDVSVSGPDGAVGEADRSDLGSDADSNTIGGAGPGRIPPH